MGLSPGRIRGPAGPTSPGTAWLLRRGDPRAALTATAGAALLLADAWFDVCTAAPGPGRLVALAEAGLAEVPLAAAGVWLAVRLARPQR